MLMPKVCLLLVCLGTAAFAAEVHKVRLGHVCYVGGTELKPGEYSLVLDNGRATLRRGFVEADSRAKVASARKPYDLTTVRYTGDKEHDSITEIEVGGTRTKVVFEQLTEIGRRR
jgi:hypothetical protein